MIIIVTYLSRRKRGSKLAMNEIREMHASLHNFVFFFLLVLLFSFHVHFNSGFFSDEKRARIQRRQKKNHKMENGKPKSEFEGNDVL